ncbi:helix-turn-helix domain-containing protein [Pseudomonas savastanoi]|uniref:helix-turn-helix domain-containing protein n=1 Tax=Pseudomonas savastanoi TaxID=29438 RepID=UPI00177D13E7|nr:helix-turn-helix domain-containing protein [Pseudomonas savastanoi]QOI07881.1 helix-turn-helix domain-containing protein [Pseudomonas savastanoi]
MSDEIRKLHQPAIRGTWVQTERAGHEAWAHLSLKAPKAASLLHILVANMDERGALVASQKTLAKLCGVSHSTIKRALDELTTNNWVQTIRIGGERGGTLAYVVNSRIAWADSREKLNLARFTANVLISSEDQEELGDAPLCKAPVLRAGEMQLPSGEGAEPPAQALLPGMTPDLPFLKSSQQD